MKFSIIVPVFNVEKYLEECIYSVINQSYQSLELILVNDGSTDNSSIICDYFADTYDNIHVIHQKNAGLSEARNAGLEKAKGEYILFLDSDNYLTEQILEKVNNQLVRNESLDLLICTRNNLTENNIEFIPMDIEPQNTIMNKKELLRELASYPNVHWSAWLNVFKNGIIQDNNIKFEKKLIGAEECDFFIKYIEKSEKIVACNIPLVNYRLMREGSITATMSLEAIKGQLHVFSKYHYYYKSSNNQLSRYFSKKYSNTVYLIHHLSKKQDIKKCEEIIKKDRDIFKYSHGLKCFLSTFLWGTLGYYKGSLFLSRMSKFLEGIK